MKSGAAPANEASTIDPVHRQRAANRRTAWILSSVAIVFFVGIIGTRWTGATVGIGIMGTLALLFLVIAVGRNLRDTDERAGADATSATRR